VTQARADLDLDPFDAPIDARVYVTYTNISNNPIAAVNFRIRLADGTGKNLGTFRGADGNLLGPGQEHSQKWKHEKVDQHVTAMQIRVLQVRYADGTMWESAKMREINNPQPAAEDGATPAPQESR
jgi:hypothetical protein